MKFTVKHALITCLGLAILAILLPWFCVGSLVNISGAQIACSLGLSLGFMGEVNKLLSLVASLASSVLPASMTGGMIVLVTLLMIVALAPFVATIVSLFMSIFGNSQKVTVAVLVMQIYNTLLAVAYVVFFIYLANLINNVAIYNVEAGAYVYLAASLAASIVSVLILKRYIDSEATPVHSNPGKGGLLCLTGEYPGVSLPLDGKNVVVIGRDASCCNLVVKGGKISRKHCEISYDAQRALYRVVDYSTNGTYVKGGSRLQKERPTELVAGTVLLLGNEENSFRLQ